MNEYPKNQSNSGVVAIVQARVGSMRFPRKVFVPVLGRPLVEHLLERLGRAQEVSQIVLAIPDTPENLDLAVLADSCGVYWVGGPEEDVLARYQLAAARTNANVVVRITGDCPLVDPHLVDRLVAIQRRQGLQYVATSDLYADGFDVEVFTRAALDHAAKEATDRYDREHVTPFIRRHVLSGTLIVDPDEPFLDERVTLDEPEDAEVLVAIFERFGHNQFTMEQVNQLMHDSPELFEANRKYGRNQGAGMSSGEKLWERAKRVIPGGNMLLSKRAEMHLPAGWPTYFSSAKGCRVRDLDGIEYIDVGLMGVGTNILGYGHPKVDEAVRQVIDQGNTSTLNCPEEVLLAERLVELHPWANMAKFTRGGGEACAVAVRIARAASGRSGVAFCGYHGWHDWYLAANLASESVLDGHLLPGLKPAGVPRGLEGISKTFTYNDAESLSRLLTEDKDIGVIFMEVERGSEPAPGFLESVRSLADEHNAVLVFDECTSGFRRNLGGIHLHYRVHPDLAVFGKTLGNGYAIAAVIGREPVMQAAQDTFISSTFWTERIGPSAALAALDIMTDEEAPQRVHQIGLDVRALWTQLATDTGLRLITGGIPALGGFHIQHFDPIAVKTFVTQEMLAKGFLAGTSLYASLAHQPDILVRYADALQPVFAEMSTFDSDDDLISRLPSGIAQSGFLRIT